MSHPISDGRRIRIVVKHPMMKQNNSGKMQRNVGIGNMNVSVVYRRVWDIVDLKYWGTGNVLGQCRNEFWVNTNSRRTLSIQILWLMNLQGQIVSTLLVFCMLVLG